ncbi:histone-lysine N-methyltransferase PR-Set7 [Neodiprion fabricii]|uniref:histone-lysine N-methyltransferase PR-Set7 n=1 Tax=Neodiprion fabricii TaxID=2872261 RepID=UPI001ED8DB65|nr:histone-lysine N-methyltransferase PR-Set7 [Neodiprion fabricii]
MYKMDIHLRSGHRQKKLDTTDNQKQFLNNLEDQFSCTRSSPRRQNGFDQQLFKTDETPVAVPVNGPPTPHRINMTRTDSEDSEKPNAGDNTNMSKIFYRESPSTVLDNVQNPAKKSLKKGRRKLNPNNTDGQGLLKMTANRTNHKLTDYFPVRRSVRKCKRTVLEEQQRDMENKVLCQVQDGLKIQEFIGKGRGIVTTREFRKGDFVVEYIGDLIDQNMAKKREAEYARDHSTGCYMYYFKHRNQQYCVDATPESDKLGRLVNHSRNGNLIARVIEVGSIPHLVLTAKDDVPRGVEVTYDYGDRSRESIRNHPWLAL